jgi:hypothetical protein
MATIFRCIALPGPTVLRQLTRESRAAAQIEAVRIKQVEREEGEPIVGSGSAATHSPISFAARSPVARRGSFLMLARHVAMSLLERLMVAIVGVLVVGALVLAMELDIGRNSGIPAGGILEQPARK